MIIPRYGIHIGKKIKDFNIVGLLKIRSMGGVSPTRNLQILILFLWIYIPYGKLRAGNGIKNIFGS